MFCSHKTHSLFAIFLILMSFSLVKWANAVEPDCLESKTHKPKPTEESILYGEVTSSIFFQENQKIIKRIFNKISFCFKCKPWKNMACCNKTTSETIHLANTTWSNFNYDHCYRMSNRCKRRFLQELCFYECDPYLHRYVVGVSKDSTELFMVP
jgi:hypothetical protein